MLLAWRLSLRQIRQISRITPNNVLGLPPPLPDNRQSADNAYLVASPFIMRMLSVLGDNVFQFFRQGKTVDWEKKNIIDSISILARHGRRQVETAVCCHSRDLLAAYLIAWATSDVVTLLSRVERPVLCFRHPTWLDFFPESSAHWWPSSSRSGLSWLPKYHCGFRASSGLWHWESCHPIALVWEQ